MLMNVTAMLNITCWDGTFYYSPGWWYSSGCPHTGIHPPILVFRATTQAAMRRCLIFNVYFNIVRSHFFCYSSYSNSLSSIFLLSFSGTLEMFGNSAGIKYYENMKMLSVQYENIRCLLVCVNLPSCVSERLGILLLSVPNWLLHSPAILLTSWCTYVSHLLFLLSLIFSNEGTHQSSANTRFFI